ncbi:hypothetical protein [Cytobacillus oceanisediminis]|uniref:hypothetical protein n=1 Tax=Cytobacillus oceanisediminis TaxID=665099 RepID=UPI00207A735C|nr:hypothetical protein [Cytobacillus oceanisediminis]USK44927.1 hypothetical protein LIT27_03360 [Cytobacillus oceanisediminis]
MSGFIIIGLLLIIMIAIGDSRPSNRSYGSGKNHSSYHHTGDYSSSHNCDSLEGALAEMAEAAGEAISHLFFLTSVCKI